MDKKVTGVVAYLGLVGFLVAYLAGDKEGAKFHLNQALVLAIAGAVGGTVFGTLTGVLSAIPLFGWALALVVGIIAGVFGIATFVLMIIGIINAANDQETPLPLIGGFQILQ